MPLLVGLEGALLAALLLAAGLVYYTLYDPVKRRALAIAKTYPQPKALPIIGHVLHVFKQRDELFLLGRSFRERHGSRYSINMFSRTFFNISDPEAVEVVLSSSKHSTKGYVYGFLEPWLGQGLLTSNGPLWHSRRKLLTPAFHFRILDQFSEHLEKQAVRLVDELDAAVRAAPDANSVDVVPFISSSTLRSICVTAMGNVKFRTDDTMSEKSYFDAIHSVGLLVVFRMIRPWLWPPLFFKLSSIYKKFVKDLATLHRCTEKMIAERKVALLDAGDAEPMVGDTEEGTRGARQRRPFLDVLLQAQRDGADLSDRDIREEVDTFMFEGHDTTSMALSWSLELLGRHADVQARLVEELDGVDSDWESISKLPYLDRVLKECLRLRPSVPFISRLLDSDALTPDGQIFPAGGQVNVHIYDLHRHPDHFPDPERFDPDRFLPALEQARHPFAYLPFSAGPRNCIGKRFAVMELKILLASVVRRFNIQSAMKICGGREFIADIVLRPRSGVHLRLTPRQL